MQNIGLWILNSLQLSKEYVLPDAVTRFRQGLGSIN